MSNPAEHFQIAIAAAGLTPPDALIDDGKLHRFSTDTRPDKTGWYILHTDGIAAGAFGDWRSALTVPWCSKADNDMTEAEREAHRERTQAMKAQRETDKATQHQQAREAVALLWSNAEPVTAHPYLTTKGIQPHGVRAFGDMLLIPMHDTAGKLHSLQTIAPDGSKRFHPGGRVKGCYHAIGKPTGGMLIVCEGFATGASIFEATQHAVAVTFNAGNLEAVAIALKAKYPTLTLCIAADDDHLTEGNPGMTKASAAAHAVNGLIAAPLFGEDRPVKATDFNDLHQLAGAAAVVQCMGAARPAWGAGNSALSAEPVANPVQAWPEPTPLPTALLPVMAFHADLLPEALRDWVLDIAHRMQCPPDFAAVGAVVALSSLIGAKAVVHPKERDDWQVTPNLWGLIVGRPGAMKSPALGEALKPLHRLQSTEFERHKESHEAWVLDCKVTELQNAERAGKAKALAVKDPLAARALLEPAATTEEPLARRYIVNDATVEKLGEILTANPWGTLSYRDELYGLLTGMDKQGQEGARSFYLQGYDGNQGYTFDRIARGTLHIPRVCLAMIGGIQPGRIQSYVRDAVAGGSADDGLLQRFSLTVWPDTGGGFVHVDQWPDTPAKITAWAVFERLANLAPASDTEATVWRFSPEAQALFVEWRTAFEQELQGGELHPAMESHLAKYRKLIPALALVFANIDTPDNGQVVHARELMRALAWSEYLRTHADRLYAAAVTPETSGARALLTKIRAGKLTDRDGVVLDGFTPRELAVKHWAELTTPEAVRKAAEVLADYDWLRREVVPADPKGGRTKERYAINPAAMTAQVKVSP